MWYDFYFCITSWSQCFYLFLIITIFINSCIYLFIFHIFLDLTSQNWTHFFKKGDQVRLEIPQHSLKILDLHSYDLRSEWLFWYLYALIIYLFIWFWFNFPFYLTLILLINLISIHSRFLFKSPAQSNVLRHRLKDNTPQVQCDPLIGNL